MATSPPATENARAYGGSTISSLAIAIVDEKGSMTYADLDAAADHFLQVLQVSASPPAMQSHTSSSRA